MLIHISDLSTVYIFDQSLGIKDLWTFTFSTSEYKSVSSSVERYLGLDVEREEASVSRSEPDIFRLGSNIYTLICNQLPLVSSHVPYYIMI